MKDLDAIYFAARELTPEGRPAYLAQACAGDDALRARVEQMLSISGAAEAFITDLAEAGAEARGPGHNPMLQLERSDLADENIGQSIGRYIIREKLGEGGCGVVYVAEQTEPVCRQVALKVIKRGMDTKAVVARFEAERQALAMMDHPNIAKVHDAGTTETGRPYFVMELVRGTRVTDYCDEAKLNTRDRLDLLIKVCHAIQHAHQKGIIHRDIKPANILVTLHDGVPVPKVIDFGIAKATEGRLTDATVYTQLHQFIGTPAYTSPEQAEMSGLDIDTRSDIYSLGVLLYEMLAGCTPFDAQELMSSGLDAMRRTIREQEPQRPSTRLAALGSDHLTTAATHRAVDTSRLLRQLMGDLDWIVMKCLEKDRTRRYETANGLANDLKRHLNNEPVVARPPSAAYRLQKAFRRNKSAFVAVFAVGLALIIGTTVSVWQAVEATRARRDEHEQRVAAQQSEARASAQQKRAETERQRAEDQLDRAERLVYASKLVQAQTDFEVGNGGLARRCLEECRPELRGWEWRYLWNRVNALQTLTLSSMATSASFSADGRRLLTVDRRGVAKVWDAATSRQKLRLQLQHEHLVIVAAFSPDGTRILTGAGTAREPGELKIWDARTGELLHDLIGHSAEVMTVAFSPDGRRIVSGGGDHSSGGPGETKVWDAQSGKEVLSLPGHPSGTHGVTFSPDGARIVTCGGDLAAKVWDAASGALLLALTGHRYPLSRVACSSDGRRIVTGSGDGTVRIWNAATGHELVALKGHAGPVNDVAFSPDGKRVATVGRDWAAKIWEAESGQELFSLKGHGNGLRSVNFSPDGRRLVTSGDDRTVRVWDAVGGQSALTLHASRDMDGIAFSSDSRCIVTTGGNGTARLWDATTGREIRSFGSPDKNWDNSGLLGVAFSPDGQRLLAGSVDQSARVWDVVTGQELLRLNHDKPVCSVAFSPDGHRILTGAAERFSARSPGDISVWDAITGQPVLRVNQAKAVWSVVFSPDGQHILASGGDASPRILEATTGREILVLRGHRDSVHSAAFSQDGRRIVTASRDRTAKVWNATTGQELLTLKGHTEVLRRAAFTPDGERIVTGSEDRLAKIWNAATGQELLSLPEHADLVWSLAISPDGQRIATGVTGANATARIWYAAPTP